MFPTRRPASGAAAQQTVVRGPSQLQVERFERIERLLHLPDGSAALRLLARAPSEIPRSAWPSLVVRSASADLEFEPLMGYSGCVPVRDSREWMLGAAFAPPRQCADDPSAVFALRLESGAMLALPVPGKPVFQGEGSGSGLASRRPWPYVVRRLPPLVVATCQAFVLASALSAGALADSTPTASTSVQGQVVNTGTTGPTGPTGPDGNGGQSSQPPAGGSGPTPPAVTPPDGAGGQQPPSGGDAGQQGSPGPATAQAPQTIGSSPGSPVVSAPPAPVVKRPAALTPPGGHASPHGHRHRPVKPRHGNAKPRRAARTRRQAAAPVVVPSTAAGTLAPLGAPLDLSGLLPNPSWLTSSGATSVALVANQPPSFLIPIYKHAGHRYGIPWRVLASINALETDYGHNLSVSSAGAMGWMQFMPGTWREWAVDANGDGSKNPYDPADAIYTAARYLHVSAYRGRYKGRARWSLRHAIYAYNHAHWYVEAVLLGTQLLGGGGHASAARANKDLSLPLDPWYMNALGRTDDGVDIETAPDGALVYSMTTGVVTAVATDPAGFGPNYPVVKATKGALKGQDIYYGHVAKSLVKPGQKVYAGQPIAIIGTAGDAASLGHGHIEIGFSDAGGNPLSHHGALAWTSAGQGMRTVMVSLSASFGIHNS